MKSKKMKKKITEKTKFNEIFEDKEALDLLEEKGMHCLGCPFAQVETLEQGAKAHGLDAGELVEEINKRKKSRRRKKK